MNPEISTASDRFGTTGHPQRPVFAATRCHEFPEFSDHSETKEPGVMNALNKASLVATGATFARSYSTPDVPTLADGLRLVDASTALSGDQRRNLRSDLKTVAAMLRRAPDAILLDCPALSDALLTRPSRAYGLAPRRHRNVMSSLPIAQPLRARSAELVDLPDPLTPARSQPRPSGSRSTAPCT